MSGIDDPIDAVKKQYPEQSLSAVDVLLDVVAESHPFAGMANAIRDFFSKKEAEARVKALLEALEWLIREHEKRIDDLSERLNSPEFGEILLVAVNETLRTANVQKIKRFAKVLGNELISNNNPISTDDAAAYIRDLSELGEADISALSILHEFQRSISFDVLSTGSGPVLVENMRQILMEVRKRGMEREEFYLRCSKLGGYGLVLSIEKRGVGASPDSLIFLLSSSGKKIFAHL